MQSNSAKKRVALLILALSVFSATQAYGQKESKKKDASLTEEQLYKLHIEAKLRCRQARHFISLR